MSGPGHVLPARAGAPRADITWRRVAVVAISAVLVPPLLSSQAAAQAATVALSYPTADAPAAAQAGELFDVDVVASMPGVIQGEISPAGAGAWEPLDVVTLDEVVEPGVAPATATVPDGTAPGSYDMRVRLLDGDGSVLAEAEAPGGLTVEDYGLPTGFESREGASWTTHDEELDYLAEITEASGRAEMEVIGESVEGRPMHLVRVGYPAAPSVAEAAEGRAVMFVCSQHGNEPAPRESCLKELRRLAFTQDSRTREYLASNPVFIIPSANPDGRARNTRRNADGFDLNRDHLRLVTVEAQTMANAMRDVQPDVLGDLHEFGTGSPNRTMFEWIWARHLNVDTEVRALAVEWGREWLSPRLAANGITNAQYQANPGTGENVTILNSAGLRHITGVLTESRTSAVPGETGGTAAVQLRRVRSQDHAIHETLRFHRDNADRIEQTNTEGRQRKIDAGRFREGPYFWYGNSEDLPQLPPDDAILDDPPCGYVLTQEQVEDVQPWIDGFGVHTVRVGDQTYVPMGQAAQTVIGLKLDGRAQSNDVVAEPWPSEPVGTHLACATDRKGFEPR